MSGLLALLDDVAAIAKVAAASVDDVIGQAAKAGSKAAGAVIDDAAVSPKYVHGFAPARELPIVWKIARGSFFNKLVILLPIALLLSAFAPWAIPPLLMLGGAYLCYEGAEKVLHAFQHHDPHSKATGDPAHLEEQKVRGAIKTDFILSAEIMTISLAAITVPNIWMQAAVLAVVGISITVAVYGAVAAIVKADDLGLLMATSGRLGVTRTLGRGIVHGMPTFLFVLTWVGTAAMLWVGGQIVVHGLGQMGWHGPEDLVHGWAVAVGHMVPANYTGIVEWIVTAASDGVLGIILGLLIIPLVSFVITPIYRAVRPA
ncbi:DUF808 domain-containing protein [Loktanella sp. DJP18]|uniref:DUF808 domain-containing protein n=1 Tax=Loktanella sp. DJP18 TaxID=3409788 RepID=UPI003BB7ED88